MNVTLHIVGMSDRGVQCATQNSTGWSFWLPREGHVQWVHPPEVGSLMTAFVPEWLAQSTGSWLVMLRTRASDTQTMERQTQ